MHLHQHGIYYIRPRENMDCSRENMGEITSSIPHVLLTLTTDHCSCYIPGRSGDCCSFIERDRRPTWYENPCRDT